MPQLTGAELEHFRSQGYVVVRGAVAEADVARAEAAYRRHDPADQATGSATYPEPARYTLARSNAAADPELGFLAHAPELVDPVTQVLEDDPRLMMYVVYDRTPGGPGLPAHHDYKRWRPIGSSVRWTFAIVPFTDFDPDAGPLFVAPGSHRVGTTPVPRTDGLPLYDVEPPKRPDAESFIDPGLRRGDLLLMDMHTWHRAPRNESDGSRIGLFTKYGAASCPPATGWFVHDESVREAFGPKGEHLLAVTSDLPRTLTRAYIDRVRNGRTQVLLMPGAQGPSLPGGPAEGERSIPDWDDGNYLASLQRHLGDQLRTTMPWMSYVGDWPEGDELCRVYGYRVPGHAWGVNGGEGQWVDVDELADRVDELAQPWIVEAAAEWGRGDVRRGKAVTQAVARADQYAA